MVSSYQLRSSVFPSARLTLHEAWFALTSFLAKCWLLQLGAHLCCDRPLWKSTRNALESGTDYTGNGDNTMRCVLLPTAKPEPERGSDAGVGVTVSIRTVAKQSGAVAAVA